MPEVWWSVVGQRGPFVLAVHGGPGMDHGAFRPWLDPLAEVVRLVYFDLPGCGRSPAPTDYSLEAMADAVDAVRREVGAERVHLLGHSYGGFISLVYALRYGPRVAGLVLVDTAASYGFRNESLDNARRRATPDVLAALDRLWDPVALTTDDEFRRDWRSILPLYFASAEPSRVAQVAAATTYRLAARKAILPTFSDYDVRPRLPEIQAPALVIAGRHDWITSVEQAEVLAVGLPNSQLVVFEQSGHLPFVEEPELFLRIVRSWLAEPDRSGPARRTARSCSRQDR